MSLPADLEREDIGHGVWIHRVTGGLIVGHLHDDGSECCGSILFDVPEMRAKKAAGCPLWSVKIEEPLTVMPAIIGPECNLRGFIEAGKWVPCDNGKYRPTTEEQ